MLDLTGMPLTPAGNTIKAVSYAQAVPTVLRSLVPSDIQIVAAMHHANLPGSLNSRLGVGHLCRIYDTLRLNPACLVLVASVGDQLVGVVSATTNPQQMMQQLMRTQTLWQWVQLLGRILRHPSVIVDFIENIKLNNPVIYNGRIIHAYLSALIVDSAYRQRGIGRVLVSAVDDYFRRQGYSAYHLNTDACNQVSHAFYMRMGFQSIEQRGCQVVLVKDLQVQAPSNGTGHV